MARWRWRPFAKPSDESFSFPFDRVDGAEEGSLTASALSQTAIGKRDDPRLPAPNAMQRKTINY